METHLSGIANPNHLPNTLTHTTNTPQTTHTSHTYKDHFIPTGKWGSEKGPKISQTRWQEGITNESKYSITFTTYHTHTIRTHSLHTHTFTTHTYTFVYIHI